MPSIYEKPVCDLMLEMAEDLASAPGRFFRRQDAVEWFRKNYPLVKPGTVTAHLTRFSTNAPSRLHHRVRVGADDLFFQADDGRFRRYEPDRDPAPLHPDQLMDPLPDATDGDGENDAGSREFAYEADLKRYLSKNLSLIEDGLKLYQEGEISGIEYPVGGRFIDLLAVDRQGALVVIELKVSRGYDRVVGQLMRYMGWIQMNLADEGQQVRGMIVARQISEDLRLACSLLSNVQLLEYSLSVSLKKIAT